MNVRIAIFLAATLSLAPVGARTVRADDPKLTPEQIKAQQKEKDLKKAHDDLDKELKTKKADPVFVQAAHGYLDKLAMQVNLDVKPSVDYLHKVMAKKIPFGDAMNAADDFIRKAVDPKTSKIDYTKWNADYTKWITTWKPPAPAPAAPAPAPAK
jgi:hypothetical protein